MPQITMSDVWVLLLSFGSREKEFNEQYNIYWRSTKFTPQEQWFKGQLHWTFKRDYGKNSNDNIECCIQIDDCRAPPWFIWNDSFGFDSLVVVPKIKE